ncbi:MAG TPA: ATP-binding protein [Gemmatimonadaceae bacterium]
MIPFTPKTPTTLYYDPASSSRATRQGLSIQTRLLALVAAAALPLVVFGLAEMRLASRKAREATEQDALQSARRISAAVDDHVSVIDASLLTLTRTLRIDPRRPDANDAIIAAVSRELGLRFREVFVADPSGRIIGLSSGSAASLALNISDRKYFKDAIASPGIAVGEPVIGRLRHEYTIGLARAIRDSSNRVRGVVAASTSLALLSSILVPKDLPPRAVITLMNDRGVIVMRTPDSGSYTGRSLDSLAPVRALLAQREGVQEGYSLDGVPRLLGFTTATRVPWHVFVAIPSDVAMSGVRSETRNAVMLIVASLVLSLALAWFFSYRISDPIAALTRDAAAFGNGDLGHRTRTRGTGELGRLSETFNRMAAALERRSAELTQSEHRYRDLFDKLPLPLWVYDVDSLRFLAVNEAALTQYGYSREEFLRGMTVVDIRPQEDQGRFLSAVRTVSRGSVQAQSWRHRTKGGEILDVEISSDDIVAAGVRARLVVAIDVTNRNRTEAALRASQEQLRQSQKMEAVGSLAGGIAHDFNNLLTAILGYCDLALDEEPAHESVTEIRQAALRASELTRQLLAFSRRQVLKPMVFPLNDAVQSADRILRRLIPESIELELALAATGSRILADPSQVEQVIINLAVNARDAMPRGGNLIIGTAVVQLHVPLVVAGATLPPGRYATLTVTDTGTGIDPQISDRLFEPFFTTKERGHGTGLGLATVYGIVKQSEGGVNVRSSLGRGSTFTAYFPLVLSTDEARDATDRTEVPSRGEGTILLAEDDDAVRAIAQVVLERAGYRVVAAPDGASALALADACNEDLDLLVTDVIMPGMNGRELAEALTLRRPGLPVLFVSGYTDNALKGLGLLSSEHALLDKPFTPASLTGAVAAILRGTGTAGHA